MAAGESLALVPQWSNEELPYKLHFLRRRPPRAGEQVCGGTAGAHGHNAAAWPWEFAPEAEPGCCARTGPNSR